jgi:hypothetical protein
LGRIQNVIVPETKDTEALASQPCVAPDITPTISMLAAICLNYQLGIQTNKIDNIPITQNGLALPFPVRESRRAQSLPKLAFSIGRIRAHGAGSFQQN